MTGKHKSNRYDANSDHSHLSSSSSLCCGGGGGGGCNGGRQRPPRGKLVDPGRTIVEYGITRVDNRDVISPELASIVAKKALQFNVAFENEENDEGLEIKGQIGLIRGDELRPTKPLFFHDESPTKRRIVEDLDGTISQEDVVTVVSSRFEVLPTTALQNVITEKNCHGIKEIYKHSMAVAPDGRKLFVNINPGGEGCDVVQAFAFSNERSDFTLETSSFERMDREDYCFRKGQKIGMAIFRDFDICAGDITGAFDLSEEDIQRIYGRKNQVNIYTGQITRVCEGGDWFEHSINTFSGCDGAIIFLLDYEQGDETVGVLREDVGKAIAVHVGGQRNYGFKL